MPVGQFHGKHGVRQGFDDLAFDFDDVTFGQKRPPSGGVDEWRVLQGLEKRADLLIRQGLGFISLSQAGHFMTNGPQVLAAFFLGPVYSPQTAVGNQYKISVQLI
jgi:hypothetical protein